MYYMAINADGNELTSGVTLRAALAVAKIYANEHGEMVDVASSDGSETYEVMPRADMLSALARAVGDDGTGDLGVIVDHAQPTDTVADLVEVVREARAEAAAERANGY